MANSNSRTLRFTLLFALALTEVMPIMLVSQALPVLLRRGGASMEQIGFLFLAMFPWSLKALWAPLIDKLGARSRFGRYRTWLLFTHPLLLATLVAGSFWDVPAMLLHNRNAAIPALLWLTAVCAIADAASHGLAVTLLSPDERGMGNGIQTVGLMAGQLLGGGLMVMFVGRFGWQPGLLVVSAFLLLPIPGILLYREQPADPKQTLTFRDVAAFFKQRHAGRWLLVVAIMPIGAALVAPLVELLLVDRGFNLAEIGLVMGVLAGIAGATGGVVGGLTVRRFGRERSFYALTIFCSVCLAMVLLSHFATGRFLLYLVVSFPTLGLMARATMLHALMMDRCRPHIASTDFTIQYTLQHVSRLLWMSAGAFAASRFGTTAVFILGPVLTIGALIVASRLLDSTDFQAVFHKRDNAPHDQTDAPKGEETLAA